RVRVNDDPVGNGKSQFNPAIALDQTSGIVALTWYDTRNSGTANNTTQIFGSVSLDGGLTFLPNMQISAGTSNATLTGTSFDYGNYATMISPNPAFNRSGATTPNSTGNNPTGPLPGTTLYPAKVFVGSPAGPSVISQTPASDAFGQISSV